ncbi:MAG: Flagellar biosynthesis/type III secretory pathway protein [Pelotomaculum thermopropionicum]|uniref:Flagellar biosynthesis/type III secretory pathway protein n=1 Tax=Pelotomaculum thermopropionicum TaxID=110500 RepID=A0A101HS78_9FIRM|nr:MAG: Flagellar biosynthesis/type III secretory pathway protein [Pelotomaculum thermopropionicum]
MSFSFRVIKGVDVGEDYQSLPLRNFTSREILTDKKNRGNGKQTPGVMTEKDALARFEEIVSDARIKAGEITRRANSDAERIKKDAYREAFDRGLREGYREGLEKAADEAGKIRAQAREVLDQAETIRRSTLEALEGEIIDLAREIAEKLLNLQLSLEPESVLGVAEEALRLVAGRTSVVLYVNPSELDLVESKKSAMLIQLPAKAELRVIADRSIQPGGCLVETERGRVDATLEKRREELFKALYGEVVSEK